LTVLGNEAPVWRQCTRTQSQRRFADASVLLTNNTMVASQSSKMINNKINTSVTVRNYRAYERQFHH